jgi:L-rhamnose mutarotase
MVRKAFRMSVDRGRESEYERRHNPIWAELEATFAEHGVRSYSIFLDRVTNDLFAYAEIESEERWQAIAATSTCRRWWETMTDLMPSNTDASPVSRDLYEVFHIELPSPPVGARLVEAGIMESVLRLRPTVVREGSR